jgi:hypothetical protein
LIIDEQSDYQDGNTSPGSQKSVSIFKVAPSRLKLPITRQMRSGDRVYQATMPCIPTLTCRLPPIDSKKQKSGSITLSRLSALRMSEYGLRLGLYEWLEGLPHRIIRLLAKKTKLKGVEPLLQDFRNSRGLLRCPLCDGIKEFAQVRFTKHLWTKH